MSESCIDYVYDGDHECDMCGSNDVVVQVWPSWRHGSGPNGEWSICRKCGERLQCILDGVKAKEGDQKESHRLSPGEVGKMMFPIEKLPESKPTYLDIPFSGIHPSYSEICSGEEARKLETYSEICEILGIDGNKNNLVEQRIQNLVNLEKEYMEDKDYQEENRTLKDKLSKVYDELAGIASYILEE